MTLLKVKGLTMRFGGLLAVTDFNLNLDKGELVGLIGPNGAGKTTAFNMLTGRLKPAAGSMVFDGSDIGGKKPNQINRLGIGRTFQSIHLLTEMSALENVMMSFHGRLKSSFLAPILGFPGYRREERAMLKESHDLLKRVGLEDLAQTEAGSLAYGQQRRLEIARALGVDAIVEGSVLMVGERVRINAQLIDGRREQHLWAEAYERDLRDVLALHQEVALAIAKQVRVTLTPEDQVRLTQSPSGGGKGNPAWDFQFLISDYEIGQRYQYQLRALVVPYDSPEQIERVTAPHREALGQ